MIGLLTVVALLIVYAATRGLNQKYNVGPTGDEVALDDTLRVGHASYTINDMEVTETIMMDGEERGVTEGVFLILDVTVENHYFTRSFMFSPNNFYFQYDGDFYPSVPYIEGISLAIAEEREAYAFEDQNLIDKRSAKDGIVVFLIDENWLDAADAGIYVMAEDRNYEEQDGYIYFNQENE